VSRKIGIEFNVQVNGAILDLPDGITSLASANGLPSLLAVVSHRQSQSLQRGKTKIKFLFFFFFFLRKFCKILAGKWYLKQKQTNNPFGHVLVETSLLCLLAVGAQNPVYEMTCRKTPAAHFVALQQNDHQSISCLSCTA
jgi:hypothetical protein